MSVLQKGADIINSIKSRQGSAYTAVMGGPQCILVQQDTSLNNVSRMPKQYRKDVRYSVDFVRSLSIYSLMQGFMIRIKRKMMDYDDGRSVDFKTACTKIVDICEYLFNNIPGYIEPATALQVYGILEKFYADYLADSQYLAVFNFYLLYMVSMQEHIKIKDKRVNDKVDELIGLLSYICDMLSDDVQSVFYRKMENKVKHEKIDKAVNAFIEKQSFRAGAMYKGYIAVFESMRYDTAHSRVSDSQVQTVEKYRKLIREVPDWKEQLCLKSIDEVLGL